MPFKILRGANDKVTIKNLLEFLHVLWLSSSVLAKNENRSIGPKPLPSFQQTQSDELNAASGNARILENLEHLRDLISGNQEATSCLVKAVAQIKDHISQLNKNMEQWALAQASGRALKTTVIEEYPNKGSKRMEDDSDTRPLRPQGPEGKSGKNRRNFKIDL